MGTVQFGKMSLLPNDVNVLSTGALHTSKGVGGAVCTLGIHHDLRQ